VASLEKDYALFIFPARGFNYTGSAQKVKRLMELVYLMGPANIISSALRRNLYSGVRPEDIMARIKDGDRVFCVFNSREKLKNTLVRIKAADEGISIVVTGLVNRVREMAAEMGINPHTINLSLGTLGKTDRLPPPDIRQLTTMCGHGMVSPALVRDVIRKVKTNKTGTWDGSLTLASPCTCGIYNPHRSEDLLNEMSPLYTVDRC
jgi:hypothetical protein